MGAILNSQSKTVNTADELKHQITQLQQMTCTKESQRKSDSEEMQELEQVICSQIFKDMAYQK